MTGSKASQSARIGARSARGGYITGRNLELAPAGASQSWRTTKFPTTTPIQNCRCAHPVPGGTRLTLRHSKVPDGHTGYEQDGWQTHYFAPMKNICQAGRPAGAQICRHKKAPPQGQGGQTHQSGNRARQSC
jgi:hypothetical protein